MFRLFVLTILLTTPIFAMAKDIFISSHSAVSNRLAVFEDDERVAFLYLTDIGRQKPIKEAIAYSRVPPISRVEWEKIKETGDTPLLEQSLASNEAVISNPNEKEFSFKWSADGHSVALLRKGKPIAFASASERFGYSRAVFKSSNLANAWDQKKYEALFGK